MYAFIYFYTHVQFCLFHFVIVLNGFGTYFISQQFNLFGLLTKTDNTELLWKKTHS